MFLLKSCSKFTELNQMLQLNHLSSESSLLHDPRLITMSISYYTKSVDLTTYKFHT